MLHLRKQGEPGLFGTSGPPGEIDAQNQRSDVFIVGLILCMLDSLIAL